MPQGTSVAGTPYERLMEAQQRHRQVSAMLDRRPNALDVPVCDAALLRAGREKLGLSQAALGEALGLDAPRISGMENGKPIDKRTDLAMRALLMMEAMR